MANELLSVRGLREAFIFATTVGVIATVAGVYASYLLDFRTGPTIIAILAAIFALSYGYAALRGN
jgi:ABC-type Mn2+/Zn2+ transport system permease subunit